MRDRKGRDVTRFACTISALTAGRKRSDSTCMRLGLHSVAQLHSITYAAQLKQQVTQQKKNRHLVGDLDGNLSVVLAVEHSKESLETGMGGELRVGNHIRMMLRQTHLRSVLKTLDDMLLELELALGEVLGDGLVLQA